LDFLKFVLSAHHLFAPFIPDCSRHEGRKVVSGLVMRMVPWQSESAVLKESQKRAAKKPTEENSDRPCAIGF
jgi:hypothetical protein